MFKKHGIRRTAEDWIIDTINMFIMLIVIVVTLYPFFYAVIISFNEGIDAIKGGIYFWPRKFTLENYGTFFSDPNWRLAFLVSVSRTSIGTVLGVFFTSLVAYGLSFKGLMFKKLYMTLIIIAMYFSGGIIPYYVVLRSLGLLNKFAVYIIPTMLDMFFLLVAIAFFADIPDSLAESARIDGANEFKIFLKLILPISKPLLSTMALFIGVGQWNSWVDSAYFVQKTSLRTLTYRMMEIINLTAMPKDSMGAAATSSINSVTTFSIQITAVVVTIVPIMCVYPFIQKHFVKGVMLGAVKG